MSLHFERAIIVGLAVLPWGQFVSGNELRSIRTCAGTRIHRASELCRTSRGSVMKFDIPKGS